MPEDRRLAATMFTDIVGYTALMGKDEDQAYEWLDYAIDEYDSIIIWLKVDPTDRYRIPENRGVMNYIKKQD